jgi:hypothetical protein
VQRSLVIGLVGSTAWLMVACSSGEDLVTTAAQPETRGAVHGQGAILGPDVDLQSTKFDVTPAQRGFLDALTAAGVHPSSELEALSIGSHICQAHAAGQSDQAVWDYIAPMVRSDVSDSGSATPSMPAHTAPEPQVTEATADYIRIATQRLC